MSRLAAKEESNISQALKIGHFVQASGLSEHQAISFLNRARWNLEIALSLFFEDAAPRTITTSSNVPNNTPATPPCFPEALAAFANLRSSSPPEERPTR